MIVARLNKTKPLPREQDCSDRAKTTKTETSQFLEPLAWVVVLVVACVVETPPIPNVNSSIRKSVFPESMFLILFPIPNVNSSISICPFPLSMSHAILPTPFIACSIVVM